MNKIFKDRKKTCIWVVILSLLLMILTGCNSREKIFTIGIAGHTAFTSQVLEGFREGMAESGYIEGKNIKFIYKGVLETDKQNINAEIRELLAQDIALLLAAGNEMSLQARQLVKGTDTPVIFGPTSMPVENGLVERLNHPGGNLTGIRIANNISKALEWLITIAPGAKKVYLPYNPDDTVSVAALSDLDKTASQLGIELVLHKVHSIEETITAIENLPEDVDAIFMIPSPTLNTRNIELSQAAIKRGIPMGAAIQLDDAVVTLTNDFFDAGKKMARLAQQILHGAKPADLPVETSEVFLIINLKTAEKIGLHIPDDVLLQAKTIIR